MAVPDRYQRPCDDVATLTDLTGDPRLNYLPNSIGQEWSNTFTRGRPPLGDLEQRKMRFEGRIKLTGAMFRAGVGVLAGPMHMDYSTFQDSPLMMNSNYS